MNAVSARWHGLSILKIIHTCTFFSLILYYLHNIPNHCCSEELLSSLEYACHNLSRRMPKQIDLTTERATPCHARFSMHAPRDWSVFLNCNWPYFKPCLTSVSDLSCAYPSLSHVIVIWHPSSHAYVCIAKLVSVRQSKITWRVSVVEKYWT